MPESKFLTQLNLSPDQRLNPPKTVGKLKTIQEWASAAVDAVKDNTDFLAAIKELSPWAEAAFSAAKDSLAPVKFVVKLLDELTKIQDPEELARLACTLAYQSAAEKAIEKIGTPAHATISGPKFDDVVDEVDFSNFVLDQTVTHPFVAKADRILQHYLPQGGFSSEQTGKIVNEIHNTLPHDLQTLITAGKSKEKFDPLFRWLTLPSDGRLSQAALRRHAGYVSWLFNQAPVLQCEPYAVADVCIEAECSKLTHGVLRRKVTTGQPGPNPFLEGDQNGGRHPLLETVMEYVADPDFREPIVIQGSAGCGKSTFTLRLSDHLRQEGLRPLRIRLRDVLIGREFYMQLGDALSYQDDAYLRVHERFAAGVDPLRGGAIFHEELHFAKAKICPYVLILDGWDEISIAVSEGFRQRVKELLLRIRSELFRADRPAIRVILTGRPSDAIDDCTEFFRDETPVLTVRTLNPSQLPDYAQKLRLATQKKPLRFEGVSDWVFPADEVLTPVFDRYREEFEARKSAGPPDNSDAARPGVAAVLGYPLLLHFTYRLLAETNADRQELIESPTTLLRKLTDYATYEADRPSDRQRGVKIQARLSGSDLRMLLRRTAANMTALGQESIAKAELEKRLKITDLVQNIKDVSKDNLISALLVSFYFKGGNAALGCEFTHKAFREYLFAEEIVETLKAYARSRSDALHERPPSLYWKDFEAIDPRRNTSVDLATLLTPQWLTQDVVRFLGSLLEWEIGRSFSADDTSIDPSATAPATMEEWRRIRTLLADLWDWWADGVHLRPQPREREESVGIEWDSCLAEKLVRRCRPLTATTLAELGEPVRTATLDAHLGDALFRLSAWVHWYLQQYSHDKIDHQLRRTQSVYQGKVRFRPTGTNGTFFAQLCARISSAGWRPDGKFPRLVFARGLNLEATDMSNLDFFRADLKGTSFNRSFIDSSDFRDANLSRCSFSNARIHATSFIFARLDHSDFDAALLISNRFNGASLAGVSFSGVDDGRHVRWGSRDLMKEVAITPNDFSAAEGLESADPLAAARDSQRARRENAKSKNNPS